MTITLGGKRWEEESVYDDDYVFDESDKLSPLDDAYVNEAYRDEDY